MSTTQRARSQRRNPVTDGRILPVFAGLATTSSALGDALLTILRYQARNRRTDLLEAVQVCVEHARAGAGAR